MDTIGTRLKIARISNHLRQDEVVDRLKMVGIEVKQNAISRYENDKREIDIELLKALCRIYRVNAVSIIYSQEELEKINGETFR